MNFETQLIHGGIDGDERTGAVNVPIYETSTYKQEGIGINKGYEYSRTGNPTREAVEKLIATLENGYGGLGFASGMAAITAVLSLLKSGDQVIIPNNLYGGTFRVLDKIFSNFNIKYKLINTSDIDSVKNNINSNVKAIFIETPTNPLMDITNIREITKLAKVNNILTIVDNTFMTPYYQKPLDLGADIVVHSATKYLGGHSDLIAGLVVTKNKELWEKLHFIQNATGGVLSPFDSFLLIRGIKTLAVRMDRHSESTMKIAQFLRDHEDIEKVYYPGFKEHLGHDIHTSQATGNGGVLSFVVSKNINYKKFVQQLKIITFGESLGGVESLMCHAASMTHGAIPYEIRESIGITNYLLRLSVGLENVDDLIEDLSNALKESKNNG